MTLDVPPAAVAVIAAVVEDHRYAEPGWLARLVAQELRRQGWRITAPAGRATTLAAAAARRENGPGAR